jgi:hypothetical protein
VAEQVLEPDRAVLELGGIPGHGLVEVEPALLGELQQQGRGQRLGERGDVVERLRRRGDLAVGIGEPEPLAPDHLLVADDDRGHSWDLQPGTERFDLLLKALQSLPVLLRRRPRGGDGEGVTCNAEGEEPADDEKM